MNRPMRCELISWSEVENLCWRLAESIRASGDLPDIIIAIGRGGYIPARLLCDALNIMDLTGIKIEHYLSGSDRQAEAVIRYPLCVEVRGLSVLIVDDVNDSGDTLQLAVDHVRSFLPRQIRTAVMHDKQVTAFKVDYFARRIIKWRWLIYPWAINEDVSAFIGRLSPRPDSLVMAQTQLADEFGLRVSLRILRKVDACRDLIQAQ